MKNKSDKNMKKLTVMNVDVHLRKLFYMVNDEKNVLLSKNILSLFREKMRYHG